MSGSDQSGINQTTLGIWIATAFLLASAIVIWALTEQSRYSQTTTDNAEEYRLNADNHIRQTCLTRTGHAKADCIAIAVEAAREGQRKEYDLYSQRAVALWTLVMGYAAVFGLSLSGIGVCLIWQTWAETQRASGFVETANAIARNAIAIQTRPWFFFANGEYQINRGSIVGDVPQEFALNLTQVWKNFGHSPGVNCGTYSEFRVLPYGDPPPHFDYPAIEGNLVIPTQVPIPIGRHGLTKEDTERWLNREIDVFHYVRAEYSDPVPDMPMRWSESTVRVSFDGWVQRQNGEQEPNPAVRPEGPQNGAA